MTPARNRLDVIRKEDCGCNIIRNQHRGVTTHATCQHHRKRGLRYVAAQNWEDFEWREFEQRQGWQQMAGPRKEDIIFKCKPCGHFRRQITQCRKCGKCGSCCVCSREAKKAA